LTVSLSGQRVAAMRRRRSASASSGTLMWKVRIPMKKIAHSELMTIRSSPSDAVKNIVEQVIVMVKN
jgi:hypothetical protein